VIVFVRLSRALKSLPTWVTSALANVQPTLTETQIDAQIASAGRQRTVERRAQPFEVELPPVAL